MLMVAIFRLLQVLGLGRRRCEWLLLRLVENVGVRSRKDILLIVPILQYDLNATESAQNAGLLALETEFADFRELKLGIWVELVVD